MTCQNANNITIRFPRNGLEIQPYTVDFRIDKNQLDFLEAKFAPEVGNYIKPYTEAQDGVLREPQPAEVVMDGAVSHWMYFRPQYVTYGETNTWIELHDPQKYLKLSVVDYNIGNMTVKQIYQTLIDEVNTQDIIKDVEFAGLQGVTTNLSTGNLSGPGGIPLPSIVAMGTVLSARKEINSWTKEYDEQNNYEPEQRLTDTKYQFDIKNKTAFDALYHINNKLGLDSWVSDEGILKIGQNLVNSTAHVASLNDPRVWTYSNPELTPPGTPIKMAVVNGGMVDAPDQTNEESDLDAAIEFINPLDGHKDELIPQGVARHPNILDGKVVSMDRPNLARDGLEDRAYQLLVNEMSNNNSGSIEINPERSGTEYSDWRHVEVGDYIQLVPPENPDCSTNVDHAAYLISGVRHDIDGASWKLKLDIQKWMSPDKETTMRYFSPNSNSYYNEDFEEIYTSD